MWEQLDIGTDLTWLVKAIQEGTAVAVTDGSYNKKLAPNISGAGWIIRCKVTGKEVRGSFSEYSTSAGSYRGELLGTLAINTFLLAVEEYYHIHKNETVVFCDNKGAIYTFSKKTKRVPSGMKHADIQRAKRTVEARMKSKLKHKHVYGHQDDRRSRRSLSLEAWLNCACDELAKGAVVRAAMSTNIEKHPILPLEQATVYLCGEKQTTDITKGLRYHIGRAQAKQLYAERERNAMSSEEFEDVAWEDLRNFHKGKPMMYSLWYGKQCSGYCGTGKWLRRYDTGADSSCPNCAQEVEDADHLNKCPDFGRSQLWTRQVRELEEWLHSHHTQYHLARLIPAYLLGRGKVNFSDLGNRVKLDGGMPKGIRQAGHRQDCIGWRHFTEGKVSLAIREVQNLYLSLLPTTELTIDSWMKGLITKLVAMTHSQWIYRNITKHHHTHGTIRLGERKQIVQEIERQLEMGTTSLDTECACLLEIPQEELYNWSSEQQQYWLHAVKAARESGENALRVSNGKTTNWNQAVAEDGRERHASHTPYGEVEIKMNYTGPHGHPTSEAQGEHWGRGEKHHKVPSRSTVKNIEAKPTQAKRQRNETIKNKQVKAKAPAAVTAAGPMASEEARVADNLGLLEKPNVTPTDRGALDRLLKRPPPNRDARVVINARNSISHSSFAALGSTAWLSDEIMNYAAKVILQPTAEDVHVYSSYFMTKLLGIGLNTQRPQEPTGYNYSAVRQWTHRISPNAGNIPPAERINHLKALYVIINKGNMHWLFMKVIPAERKIQLRDSLGIVVGNDQYMQTMLRYLYDVWRETHPATRCDFDQWSGAWTCEDLSSQTPKQQNGSDCGIFTLISMYLDMQGIQLRRNTYNQQWIYTQHTRRRLAYILWKSRTNEETTPSIENFFTAATDRRKSTSSAGKKRKTRSGTIIAIGGTRVRQRITYDTFEESRVHGPENRKRSAKSIADEEVEEEGEVRFIPPPKKHKKMEEDI